MTWPIILKKSGDDGHDDHTDRHHDRSNHQCHLSTDDIQQEDGRDRHDKVDDAHDTRGQESDRVACQTDRLKNLGGIIDEGIDTRELLKEHDAAADSQAIEHTLSKEITITHESDHHATLSTLIQILWVLFSFDLSIEFNRDLDLLPLFNDQWMILRKTT